MRKNMQKQLLKIHWVALFMTFGWLAVGQVPATQLQKADSLYRQKKFTEAGQIYFTLYKQGYQSPASLLKMAYVHEGLQETGKALFFLSAYYRLTEDVRAYEKITALAAQHNIDNHKMSPGNRLLIWVGNRILMIVTVATVLALVFIALSAHSARAGNSNGRFASGFLAILFLAIALAMNVGINQSQQAVVTHTSFLMSGPSAAANLMGMIAEGNALTIVGEQDIWSKAEWNGKTVYIKTTDLLQAH
jgi:hypothetical protein